MGMFKISSKGNFNKTQKWLRKVQAKGYMQKLEQYGQLGVDALQQATPKRSGKTASSWTYEIITEGNKIEIAWKNSNVVNNVPIAVIIQYGHGTGTGGYVQGIDYINPAMRPVFEEITNNVWKEIADL